jgi:hypothetical protein
MATSMSSSAYFLLILTLNSMITYTTPTQQAMARIATAPATSDQGKRPAPRCPGAHTIAECGGPCEQDFRLCDRGLLQQLNPPRPTPTPSTRLSLAACLMPRRCSEPCQTCTAVARSVTAELGQVLRERHGGSSSVADWLEGMRP